MGFKLVQINITAHHQFQIHQLLPVSSMSRVNSSTLETYNIHPAKCHNIENGRKERLETAFQCLSPEVVVQPLLREDKTMTCPHAHGSIYLDHAKFMVLQLRFTLHKQQKETVQCETVMHV